MVVSVVNWNSHTIHILSAHSPLERERTVKVKWIASAFYVHSPKFYLFSRHLIVIANCKSHVIIELANFMSKCLNSKVPMWPRILLHLRVLLLFDLNAVFFFCRNYAWIKFFKYDLSRIALLSFWKDLFNIKDWQKMDLTWLSPQNNLKVVPVRYGHIDTNLKLCLYVWHITSVKIRRLVVDNCLYHLRYMYCKQMVIFLLMMSCVFSDPFKGGGHGL